MPVIAPVMPVRVPVDQACRIECRVMAAWVGLVPALLAGLYAAWCGNLLGGVTAAGSTTALAALLLTLGVFAGPWRDPLRLGRAWRLAPLGLWIAAAASAWLSPVPRAGLAAVVLLPAYLCLPGAVARCWEGEAARRLGARGMAAAVALLAAWALIAELTGGESAAASADPRAAVQRGEPPGFGATLAPLGHHTLLATWLATLLPLALLPLRERTAWRWLGAGAGAIAVAGVLAGRSLAGGAAVACEALVAAAWFAGRGADAGGEDGRGAGAGGKGAPGVDAGGGDRVRFTAGGGRRFRRRLPVALALLGVALAVSQGPRLARIAARRDASALARAVYFQAGWQGWRERPWLGWGPGSVPWTAAWFLAPRPGLNPWGEAVGELHSLPVHLAYETGALGLLSVLTAAGTFLGRRWRERRQAVDPGLLAAGCLGLAGAGIAWLGTAALAVTALPLALAVAAGAALAGGAAAANRAGPPRPAPWLSGTACVYGLAAAATLLAPEMARWHYDRAVAAGQAGRRPAALSELAAAVRLDPEFPLYRLRLALLQDGAGEPRASTLALSAAREGQGVGLLWLAAGILGRADGEVWAPAALEQSCALDPLSPFPPFYLVAATPGAAAAPRLGARALLAEPRLMAATFWEGREPLFRQALEEVRRWPGVDAGWKLALLAAAPAPSSRRGSIVRQELIIDSAGFTQATSLHLFRRLPWEARWQLIRLRENLVARLAMPPATALASTDGAPFQGHRCGS
ncbi:MAG: O-antigen ligase family protein [Acidobacteria bacterium]|nr:O-antigen ligase family protein [Acidobacteriota bacterium]